MGDYSALLQQILQVPVLADRIQQWADSSDSLNLVTADWKKRLENSFIYTDFKDNAKQMFNTARQTNAFRVQNVKNGPYKMLIMGMCNVYEPYQGVQNYKQPFAVTMQDCAPLNMLATAWTSDVDRNTVDISDSIKLNFGTCSVCCCHCQSAKKEMEASGHVIKFDLNQPCIFNLEVFNGQQLDYCFAPQIKRYFQTKFIGILSVAINVRYFYPLKEEQNRERVRIGGKAFSMIAFPESNLMVSTKLSLSSLPVLTATESDVEMQAACEKRPADDSDDEELINIKPKQKAVKREDTEEISVLEETVVFD